ncbi:MAG: hypothetical protein K5987_04990 [Lachnospiraceae bacterium]|nr:hypothetical protein [Lachnospiraceae bacterium]
MPKRGKEKEKISEANVLRHGRAVHLCRGFALLLYGAVITGLLPDGLRNAFDAVSIPLLLAAFGYEAEETGFFKKEWREIISFVLKRLMLPYIVFSMIRLAGEALSMIAKGTAFDEGLKTGVLESVSLYGIRELWVFPAAAISLLLFMLLRKKAGTVPSFLITSVGIIVFITLFHIFSAPDTGKGVIFFMRIVLAFFFISLGSLAAARLKESEHRRIFFALPGAFLLLVPGLTAGLLAYHSRWEFMDFRNILVSVIFSVLMCEGAFCLAVWIENVTALNFLGKNMETCLAALNVLWASTLAAAAGDIIFRITDNNFLTRGTVIIVLIAVVVFWIYLFKLPVFKAMHDTEKDIHNDV